MPAPVVHFEILGKDAKKLQDFYGKLFDWKIDADNPMNYGMVKSEGTAGIGGGVGPVEGGAPPHAIFYVEVPDTDAALKKVEEMGGKVVVPTTTIPDMVTFALFNDPEGNMIGLVKGR